VIKNPTPPPKRPRTRDEIIDAYVRLMPKPTYSSFVEDPEEDIKYGASMNHIFYRLIDAGVA
jgi:hypothetical protein